MRKSFSALVVAAAVGFAGCYGSFNLTRKLYKWNGTVGGKWANEGMFLVLTIIPVYEFASLGDALIINSIEFWTGKNPVMAKNVKSIQVGDEQAVLSFTPNDHRLRVDNFDKGRLASTIIFEQGADGMVAHDAKGAMLMRARTEGDRVVLYDAVGRKVKEYEVSALAR